MRVFIDPAMQLIRAMPVASFVILALLWVRSANLSVIVSFTHVLPVVYAGVLAGIADKMCIRDRLAGQDGSVEKSNITAVRVITRDNMFAIDKQKALFPFG